MREPDFERDGWRLNSGEERQREAPDTFWIPKREHREALYPGDFAKLMFRIALDDRDDPVSVEIMRVIVRERADWVYFGLLDNEPDTIDENDALWVGTEVQFRAEHIIDLHHANNEPVDLASRPPRKP